MSVLHTGQDWTSGGQEIVRVHAGRLIEHGGAIALWISKTRASERGAVFNLEWHPDDAASAVRPAWIRHPDGEYRAPFMLLDEETAQDLFAALWNAGMRTKESLESGAHRTTLEGHLSDMRELVAHFAKVQLPGTKGGGA